MVKRLLSSILGTELYKMPVELQQTVDSPTEISFPCNKFPGHSEASSNFKVLKRSRCRTGGTGLINSSGTIRHAAISNFGMGSR